MIKKNKWTLIASSIVILLPMLIGLFGARFLPEEIAIHWGFDGRADGFASPATAFLILPPVLLALHWLCMILTVCLDKNIEQNQKVMRVVLWIIPALSLASSGMMLSAALGNTVNAVAIVMLLLGVMFIVIGNYMPKMARSRVAGIKIKWALANDENWLATHRFGGKVYVVMGLLCLCGIPLPMKVFPMVCLAIILVGVMLPVIYSYRFYKKQIAEGKATAEDYEKGYGELIKNPKAAKMLTAIFVPVLAVLFAVIMFTGKIEMTLGEDALVIEASFVQDMTIAYEDIDAVEYREDGVDGQRLVGYASARLLLGTFQNEEFGSYTRYTYTGDAPCIVLSVDGKTVVVSTGDADTTKAMYDRLLVELAK